MKIKCYWCGKEKEVDAKEFADSLRIESTKTFVCSCGNPAKWIIDVM